VDWSHVIQPGIQWWALVNASMILQVAYKTVNILTSWAIISFSKGLWCMEIVYTNICRQLLHEIWAVTVPSAYNLHDFISLRVYLWEQFIKYSLASKSAEICLKSRGEREKQIFCKWAGSLPASKATSLLDFWGKLCCSIAVLILGLIPSSVNWN
jgi:hypothetical protein